MGIVKKLTPRRVMAFIASIIMMGSSLPGLAENNEAEITSGISTIEPFVKNPNDVSPVEEKIINSQGSSNPFQLNEALTSLANQFSLSAKENQEQARILEEKTEISKQSELDEIRQFTYDEFLDLQAESDTGYLKLDTAGIAGKKNRRKIQTLLNFKHCIKIADKLVEEGIIENGILDWTNISESQIVFRHMCDLAVNNPNKEEHIADLIFDEVEREELKDLFHRFIGILRAFKKNKFTMDTEIELEKLFEILKCGVDDEKDDSEIDGDVSLGRYDIPLGDTFIDMIIIDMEAYVNKRSDRYKYMDKKTSYSNKYVILEEKIDENNFLSRLIVLHPKLVEQLKKMDASINELREEMQDLYGKSNNK